MALRRILTKEDPMLYKKCRPVTEFNPRLHLLLDDLKDTLAQADGVGLAAPQLGILRRAVVVIETNVPEGEEERFIELVNPEIVSAEGEQTGPEGCLSAPGEYGIVERPMDVTVRAQDRNGNWFTLSGTGLTARCFCHELDHLDGHMFLEKCQRMLTDEGPSGGEDKE
ncbi:MAG TPA: peptide deformylase [Oscillospiraceae bacterium]|nr:peptide deformylase [Oscillospiraceae bacterium]HNX99300.1 peptide deformylase [Oscillospiraceae bacterium]HPS74950.1 peptide deformylase [Oscillospiraceae bacterium]